MMLSQHYYSTQSELSIILADHHDCFYGDLYDVLLEAFEEADDDDNVTMAPGCVAKNQQDAAELPATSFADKATLQSIDELEINLDQIPLPSTPPPPEQALSNPPTSLAALAALAPPPLKLKPIIVYDTLDSFEVLEQTVRKQKRLSRKKNTDMRMKVLLKRTFDLVCEIMDHENGFEDDDDAYAEKINLAKKSTSPPPPPSPLPSDDQLFKSSAVLEINVKHNDYADEYIAEASSSDSTTNVVPSSYEVVQLGKRKRDHDNEADNEVEESDDDDEDENRAAPSDSHCRATSKRQKFTSENDGNSNNNSNSSNIWCKEENESMFDDYCLCEGDVSTFDSSSKCRQDNNSVYHHHTTTTFKKEIQTNSEL